MYVYTNVDMSQRKNVCFNASMDEELLALLQEQIELGKRGNRGFKQDVYTTIATKMNESNHGVGRITASTIINHCKVLKKNFVQATELLNASGFGFDVATKRVIAEDGYRGILKRCRGEERQSIMIS
eukprot:TRINITY_DN5491_c0_g2_i1.p2 TRINITY_DN5491_c0_g2~~TRINITY_DN5491_c0_g2_i1.p2  ORF type:complete len:127 (+),score=14.08 TRINITY_DN5491_c0_g2_i1:2051-2431(+)